MKRLDKIDKKDWKYAPVESEDGFDPEHNMKVIARTIKKAEIMRLRKQRDYEDGLRDRTSAIAQYLRSTQDGNTASIEDYFGKKEMTRLRGLEIIQEIKNVKEKQVPKEAQSNKNKFR